MSSVLPAIAEGIFCTCCIVERMLLCRHVALKSGYVATNLFKKNARCCGCSFDLITRVDSADKVAVPGCTACCLYPTINTTIQRRGRGKL